jgi:hypothetical protein
MCFLMVSTFLFLWAPMHFITVYRFYDQEITATKHYADLFFVCHILAVSRSFVNPFIYACTNSKFREGFVYFVCCYHCDPKHRHLKYTPEEVVRMNSICRGATGKAFHSQRSLNHHAANSPLLFKQHPMSTDPSELFGERPNRMKTGVLQKNVTVSNINNNNSNLNFNCK